MSTEPDIANPMHIASGETTRETARTLADAALDFIASPGDDGSDDGGSDEFHLVCALQHQFSLAENPEDDPEVRRRVGSLDGERVAMGLPAPY
jgi:hypothetical protein